MFIIVSSAKKIGKRGLPLNPRGDGRLVNLGKNWYNPSSFQENFFNFDGNDVRVNLMNSENSVFSETTIFQNSEDLKKFHLDSFFRKWESNQTAVKPLNKKRQRCPN